MVFDCENWASFFSSAADSSALRSGGLIRKDATPKQRREDSQVYSFENAISIYFAFFARSHRLPDSDRKSFSGFSPVSCEVFSSE